MRIVYSERVKELEKKVFPYIDFTHIPCKLKEEAPEEIKKAYEEFCALCDEEDKKASIWIY